MPCGGIYCRHLLAKEKKINLSVHVWQKIDKKRLLAQPKKNDEARATRGAAQ
jgi:hypothetical protein